ncbi:MAG: hypothetical protein NC434_01080 [Ruminococcus sp.]|nr:hypothetical protein [Ruminococcus sp.]
MIVQHNITAMNANRMLGITTGAQAKSTEKLSSGYKINRAADDAAGLAISEKMRRQIRGLTQASANAQDGISAVQTAEGALTEVHDMLQRMNELAIKAGNGTMSESDRQSVQDEIDQLITEIDRVSETTKFNETYLLKGEGKSGKLGEVSGHIGGKIQDATVTKAKGNIFSGTMDMATGTKLDAGTEDTATVTYKDDEGNTRTKDVTFKTGADAKTTAANLAEAINNDKDLKKTFKASVDESGKLSVESKLDGTKTDDSKNAVQKIEFESLTKASDGAVGATVRYNKFKETAASPTDTEYEAMRTAATGTAYTFDLTGLTDGESITVNGKTYTYDAGKTDSNANSFKNLEDLQKLLGNDYDVDVKGSATLTEQDYKADGSTDGDARSSEVTASVTDNVVENTTSAEAAIRDTDIATEMVKYANNSILQQAGTSMLAQANQSNQLALSLLG